MVARSTWNDPSSRLTPVIVIAEPTLMSVIRAAHAIQIAVSGPIVIFPSPSLPAVVRTGLHFRLGRQGVKARVAFGTPDQMERQAVAWHVCLSYTSATRGGCVSGDNRWDRASAWTHRCKPQADLAWSI
jgi:hypothetical protein